MIALSPSGLAQWFPVCCSEWLSVPCRRSWAAAARPKLRSMFSTRGATCSVQHCEFLLIAVELTPKKECNGGGVFRYLEEMRRMKALVNVVNVVSILF